MACWAGKKVIVVGSNNSAHDICAALWENIETPVYELAPISTGHLGFTMELKDSLKHVLMSKFEIITNGGRRRRCSAAVMC